VSVAGGGSLAPEERAGYAFWGPVLVVGLLLELLGAMSGWIRGAIPWPTLSATIAHLEALHGWVAAVVAAVIAAVAFQALAPARRVRGRCVRPGLPHVRVAPAYYGWALVYASVAVAATASSLTPLDAFEHGEVVYGTLAFSGVAVPSALAYWLGRVVRFPTLFATLRLLERRLHWIALAVAVALTVLLLHLALYPWPNLARETARYAGLTAGEARDRAVSELHRLRPSTLLTYRSAARGSFGGDDAWLVSFETERGVGSSCLVAVTRTSADATAECAR